MADPCASCPREANPAKVRPALPAAPKLVAVGLAPGGVEERELAPFVGPTGRLLRAALAAAGLDPARDVGYANLARCRPAGDDFEAAEWRKAEDRCWHHLTRDLAAWRGPLLLLGSRPLARFTGDGKASVRRRRGLWTRTAEGREAFAALHPAAVLRAGEPGAPERDRLEAQFRADVRRMADRVLGRERVPDVVVEIHATPRDGRDRLAWLAARREPWFFDIETTDAAGSPARAGVATDPFHPDFRVRGVAVAWGPGEGAWVELAPWEDAKDQARALLDPAFGSPAEKGAYYAGFDESGLVVPGWTAAVRNLTRDPWLAVIALDASGVGHSLERQVVDVLGEPQPRGKDDRGRIAELSLEDVARYAVGDACATWRLDAALAGRLAREEYL